MENIGIDISSHYSKSVKKFLSRKFDYIVIVCGQAGRACPVFPGIARKIHWSISDPAQIEGTQEARLEAFHSARDELTHRLEILRGKIKFEKILGPSEKTVPLFSIASRIFP